MAESLKLIENFLSDQFYLKSRLLRAPVTNTLRMKYEVFLSFRGPDTRDSFVSCLFCDMEDMGIRVFKDNEKLRVGEKIEGGLLQALDDSQIYIPIFSKRFAESSWCLREVAHMRDCTSKSDGKKEILPVFFNVTPDDVKCETELYGAALPKHEEKYGSLEVNRWRDALVEIPTTVSWKLEGQGHGVLIKQIVQGVLLKLDGKNRRLPNHLVETDDLKHIEELLDVDSNDHVHFVVIHGTGGIGKSTLASIIFNRFRSKFECSSFLEDVRSHPPLKMQEKLLAETQGANSTKGIYDTNTGIDRIKKGLRKKKVLIVVDNVDEKKQLENLAGSCDWFGRGSRIIVTLRHLETIHNEDYQTQPSNYIHYSVKEMPSDQAIQLFSKYAFSSDTRPNNWYEFSKEVISSVGKLPLTLEVVGSFFARVKSKRENTLEDLKQAARKGVRDTLMISINKLGKIEKDIFLDIACFCIGEDKTYAEYLWHTSIDSPCSTINLLLSMSLIKIDEDNRFWMHDEVRDLGRYIVKEEDFKDPGKRRWVRIDENTEDILRSKKEKGAVQALSLCISHDITPGEIAYLPELWFLGGEGLTFVGDFENCLHSLRWLSWLRCSLDFSATNLYLENLVVLNLSRSKITDDWGGWKKIQAAKLRILDLTECHELTKTPDFSKFGKLDKLILTKCEKLSMIDSSIDKLKLLNTLDIRGCRSLKRLPKEIGSLKYLSKIIMPYFDKLNKCPKDLCKIVSFLCTLGIEQLPHSIGRLNLTHLDLSFCKKLCELPDSIGELKSLIELHLGFTGIYSLPSSIRKLKNLKYLFLFNCKGLFELPHFIGELKSLVKLNSSFLKISVLPDTIGKLVSLTHLSFYYCKNLCKLPNSIRKLKSLVKLNLECSGISVIPNSIGRLKNLKYLLLSGCRELQELPNSIGDLESLVDLDVKFSSISILPDSIERLTNLMYLGYPISKSLIQHWHSCMGEKEFFKFSESSWIFTLPHFIERLKNLKQLSLSFYRSTWMCFSTLSGNWNDWSRVTTVRPCSSHDLT
ncbi:hypothetical protein ACJRO7_032842 [Eucalyptus globulus]|uniref:TIR domain-containing protein n=1 Tax=Eucalyptus globulus TaxID=34317 RepID=A0ABD3JQY4_EUCGL